MADIVLGFDDVDAYVATDTYFGATCGRYGNSIRDGRFSLGGEEIQLRATITSIPSFEPRQHVLN
ncbi:hypothetical protein [Kaistia terrae]|uniref:Uncharacterized protein n=1 Tax=Kaistia terrae TaxID=537017 RepID=A0ABW0Q3U3_9HYPH|nr:hypothetical protein [Kaistia terrae]MCX5581174.1 hypothetical protein [Kaistia terrae]